MNRFKKTDLVVLLVQRRCAEQGGRKKRRTKYNMIALQHTSPEKVKDSKPLHGLFNRALHALTPGVGTSSFSDIKKQLSQKINKSETIFLQDTS